MDAVKFLREYRRMCSRHRCEDCPVKERPLCIGGFKDLLQEEQEMIIEVVENWSKENPEEVGKKYIIEVDGVNKDGHCHTCIGWLSKSQLEQLEEYAENEG